MSDPSKDPTKSALLHPLPSAPQQEENISLESTIFKIYPSLQAENITDKIPTLTAEQYERIFNNPYDRLLMPLHIKTDDLLQLLLVEYEQALYKYDSIANQCKGLVAEYLSVGDQCWRQENHSIKVNNCQHDIQMSQCCMVLDQVLMETRLKQDVERLKVLCRECDACNWVMNSKFIDVEHYVRMIVKRFVDDENSINVLLSALKTIADACATKWRDNFTTKLSTWLSYVVHAIVWSRNPHGLVAVARLCSCDIDDVCLKLNGTIDSCYLNLTICSVSDNVQLLQCFNVYEHVENICKNISCCTDSGVIAECLGIVRAWVNLYCCNDNSEEKTRFILSVITALLNSVAQLENKYLIFPLDGEWISTRLAIEVMTLQFQLVQKMIELNDLMFLARLGLTSEECLDLLLSCDVMNPFVLQALLNFNYSRKQLKRVVTLLYGRGMEHCSKELVTVLNELISKYPVASSYTILSQIQPTNGTLRLLQKIEMLLTSPKDWMNLLPLFDHPYDSIQVSIAKTISSKSIGPISVQVLEQLIVFLMKREEEYLSTLDGSLMFQSTLLRVYDFCYSVLVEGSASRNNEKYYEMIEYLVSKSNDSGIISDKNFGENEGNNEVDDNNNSVSLKSSFFSYLFKSLSFQKSNISLGIAGLINYYISISSNTDFDYFMSQELTNFTFIITNASLRMSLLHWKWLLGKYFTLHHTQITEQLAPLMKLTIKKDEYKSNSIFCEFMATIIKSCDKKFAIVRFFCSCLDRFVCEGALFVVAVEKLLETCCLLGNELVHVVREMILHNVDCKSSELLPLHLLEKCSIQPRGLLLQIVSIHIREISTLNSISYYSSQKSLFRMLLSMCLEDNGPWNVCYWQLFWSFCLLEFKDGCCIADHFDNDIAKILIQRYEILRHDLSHSHDIYGEMIAWVNRDYLDSSYLSKVKNCKFDSIVIDWWLEYCDWEVTTRVPIVVKSKIKEERRELEFKVKEMMFEGENMIDRLNEMNENQINSSFLDSFEKGITISTFLSITNLNKIEQIEKTNQQLTMAIQSLYAPTTTTSTIECQECKTASNIKTTTYAKTVIDISLDLLTDNYTPDCSECLWQLRCNQLTDSMFNAIIRKTFHHHHDPLSITFLFCSAMVQSVFVNLENVKMFEVFHVWAHDCTLLPLLTFVHLDRLCDAVDCYRELLLVSRNDNDLGHMAFSYSKTMNVKQWKRWLTKREEEDSNIQTSNLLSFSLLLLKSIKHHEQLTDTYNTMVLAMLSEKLTDTLDNSIFKLFLSKFLKLFHGNSMMTWNILCACHHDIDRSEIIETVDDYIQSDSHSIQVNCVKIAEFISFVGGDLVDSWFVKLFSGCDVDCAELIVKKWKLTTFNFEKLFLALIRTIDCDTGKMELLVPMLDLPWQRCTLAVIPDISYEQGCVEYFYMINKILLLSKWDDSIANYIYEYIHGMLCFYDDNKVTRLDLVVNLTDKLMSCCYSVVIEPDDHEWKSGYEGSRSPCSIYHNVLLHQASINELSRPTIALQFQRLTALKTNWLFWNVPICSKPVEVIEQFLSFPYTDNDIAYRSITCFVSLLNTMNDKNIEQCLVKHCDHRFVVQSLNCLTDVLLLARIEEEMIRSKQDDTAALEKALGDVCIPDARFKEYIDACCRVGCWCVLITVSDRLDEFDVGKILAAIPLDCGVTEKKRIDRLVERLRGRK